MLPALVAAMMAGCSLSTPAPAPKPANQEAAHAVVGSDGRTYRLVSRTQETGPGGLPLTRELWEADGDPGRLYFRKLEPSSDAPPIFLRYR